jgi:Protein of unknown function (DUF2510)
MDAVGPAAPAGWYPDAAMPGQLRYWDGTAWTAHTSPSAAPPPGAGPPPQFAQAGAQFSIPRIGDDDATVVRRLALYERLSGWAWLTLGIIQVLTAVGIIAGAWNIYAAITRIKIAPRIERRESSIPSAFTGLTGYVIIGVINLVLGGVIGLIFLGLDLYIRDQILKHRHLFGEHATAGTPAAGGPATQVPETEHGTQAGQTVVEAPGPG